MLVVEGEPGRGPGDRDLDLDVLVMGGRGGLGTGSSSNEFFSLLFSTGLLGLLRLRLRRVEGLLGGDLAGSVVTGGTGVGDGDRFPEVLAPNGPTPEVPAPCWQEKVSSSPESSLSEIVPGGTSNSGNAIQYSASC